ELAMRARLIPTTAATAVTAMPLVQTRDLPPALGVEAQAKDACAVGERADIQRAGVQASHDH
ncbi:MAG: hypothetical protein ACYCYN_01465, partial [Solirubrobacteraceae bacterium]